jgi:hypothetical protein
MNESAPQVHTTGKKRGAGSNQEAESKRRKSTHSPQAPATGEETIVQDESRKLRLSTPDLEFDYDRSQLRDPRPTQGRKARP